MALTDTFVKNTKHTGSPAGDKHADGGGMYLLIKAAGKYWRMDYKFADKRKTLTFGVYPAVSLAKARQRREKAREVTCWFGRISGKRWRRAAEWKRGSHSQCSYTRRCPLKKKFGNGWFSGTDFNR